MNIFWSESPLLSNTMKCTLSTFIVLTKLLIAGLSACDS